MVYILVSVLTWNLNGDTQLKSQYLNIVLNQLKTDGYLSANEEVDFILLQESNRNGFAGTDLNHQGYNLSYCKEKCDGGGRDYLIAVSSAWNIKRSWQILHNYRQFSQIPNNVAKGAYWIEVDNGNGDIVSLINFHNTNQLGYKERNLNLLSQNIAKLNNIASNNNYILAGDFNIVHNQTITGYMNGFSIIASNRFDYILGYSGMTHNSSVVYDTKENGTADRSIVPSDHCCLFAKINI